MSAHTSTSPTPEEPPADAAMPSSNQPSEPLSSTSAAASGTLDSSAFQKERHSSISMKRHHDDDVDYEKEDSRERASGALNDIDDDDDSNRALRETRTTNTTIAAAADTGDAVMSGSPGPKKLRRISVQLPEHIRAQKAAAAAAAVGTGTPPKPERTSSTSTASPPTTPHTPHTPTNTSQARRMSMTEDQKRASFTLTLAKSLKAAYPLSPIPPSSPTTVSPHIHSIASSLEQALYGRHSGLTLDYTAHVRDMAFNLMHSSGLARRIVDGRVSIERVSGMSWKEFADGEVQREREERKEEDLVAHLAPVDVTPGILPNAKTVER